MHKIISWYNQNRLKVWRTILAIAILVAIGYALMNAIDTNLRNSNEIKSNPEALDNSNFNSITMQSQKSAISGNNMTVTQEEVNTIDKFVSYGNSGKIEEAYNLLSDECKEEMYSNVNMFKDGYYSHVFGNGKKNTTIQNWTGNIFRVDFKEDALSTGKVSSGNSSQDYITIVTNSNGEHRLNINRYIGRTNINKTQTVENLEITVTKKDSYMDYEYYTIEAKNGNERAVLLGDVNNLEATYLKDENGLMYKGRMNEIAQSELIVNANETKTIRINYFNEFSSTRKIKNLIFPLVVIGYEEDKENYDKVIQITFDL